jgi:flagellar basal body-associated protein FliL
MSRKNFILIISAVIILILGGFAFFYLSINKNGTTATSTTQTTNPFGSTSGDKNLSTSTETQQNNQGSVPTKNTNKLIQLYRNPTSGANFTVNQNNQNILMFVDRAVGNICQITKREKCSDLQTQPFLKFRKLFGQIPELI